MRVPLYWAGTNHRQSIVAQYLIRLAAWIDRLPLEINYRVEDKK